MLAKTPVIFATTNDRKWDTILPVAREFRITLMSQPEGVEILEVQHDDVRVIASRKARDAMHLLDGPVLVHDGGCFCDGLDGFPGTNTRPILEQIGLEGILLLLKGHDRTATMQNASAYFDCEMWERGEEPKVCFDIVTGTMLTKPRGQPNNNNWSSLFQIFVPDGLTEPLSGLGLGEMQAWRKSKGEPSSYSQLFQWLTEVYWSAA